MSESTRELIENRTVSAINGIHELIEKKIQNMTKASRTSCLAIISKSALNSQNSEAGLEGSISLVFSPNQMQTFYGLSQLTQNTGFLICFIYDRPDIFVNILKQNQRKSNFPHLIQCVVPSLYGFFSSHEHLENAFKFYRKSIELCDQTLACKIIKPFFLSSPLFRFIEASLGNVLQSLLFYIFTNRSFNNNDIIDYYAETIYNTMLKTSVLIPQQHKTILRILTDIDWEFDVRWNIIWNRSIRPLCFAFIDSSPLASYKNSFSMIFAKIELKKESLFNAIMNSESSFVVPSIAPVGSNPILQCFLCLEDVISIAQMFSQEKLMPDSLSIDEFSKFPPDLVRSYFWCVAYPKFPSKSSTNNRFVTEEFQVPGANHGLELFITQELAFRDLCEWNDVIESNEIVWTQHAVEILLQNHKSHVDTHLFAETYESVASYFSLPKQKQIAFLMTLDMFIDGNRSKNEIMFFKLDQEWRSLLKKRDMQEGELNFLDFVDQMLDSHSQMLFFDAIKLMRCSDCAGLYYKFNLMGTAFMEVFSAGKGNVSFFTQLLIQANSESFMSSFLILSALVMKNPIFVDLCTSEQINAWETADSAWRNVLTSDEMLRCVAGNYSIFFIEQYSPR